MAWEIAPGSQHTVKEWAKLHAARRRWARIFCFPAHSAQKSWQRAYYLFPHLQKQKNVLCFCPRARFLWRWIKTTNWPIGLIANLIDCTTLLKKHQWELQMICLKEWHSAHWFEISLIELNWAVHWTRSLQVQPKMRLLLTFTASLWQQWVSKRMKRTWAFSFFRPWHILGNDLDWVRARTQWSSCHQQKKWGKKKPSHPEQVFEFDRF